ncbi:MAG TPA: 1-deoxy-D-xylulose-5-phosphate reductoisomerase [Opitutae bacterium]|nr:1-deoxy-D-xylulose-5-phosphate reductoisomerase [Opitutae bacterium]
MPAKKRIVLLGATGSIGDNTLEVLRGNQDHLELVGIAAHTRFEKLAQIAQEFEVPHVALYDEAACEQAAKSDLFATGTQFHSGLNGLMEIASLPDADMLVSAIVGTTGLQPTLADIEEGKDIALANKELLVLAGKFVTERAQAKGITLLPLDSEHNAIFQCLHSGKAQEIDRLILTASGGMFREHTLEAMQNITPEEALKHPNWNMGPKVTLDCSTLANKGLELIEAHWLFNIPSERIEVVIHPQSIIHSMVRFIDGSVLAQLSPPVMTFAIQNSLLYPKRTPAVNPPLDFSQAMRFDFSPPDLTGFPCLRLAREALEAGGTAPAVFNAANEIAVEAFLKKNIPFLGIPRIIEATLAKVRHFDPQNLIEILALENEARQTATEIVSQSPQLSYA